MRRIAATLGLTFALATLPLPTTAQADARSVVPTAAAVWSSVVGGESECHNVGATGIACTHDYSSDYNFSGETCKEPSVALPNCNASLSGATSGTGREVTENGRLAVCATDGVKTLTFKKSAGASGDFPAFAVTAVVDDGNGRFWGASDPKIVPGVGTVVQSASGTFTLGCGGGTGSFAGSWQLVTLQSIIS